MLRWMTCFALVLFSVSAYPQGASGTLMPSELFNRQSILTLTGAAGAVWVFTAALQHALDFNPRWLALLLSVALGVGSVLTIQSAQPVDYLIGVLNGTLIYCTAVGVNALSGKERAGAMVPKGMVPKGPEHVDAPAVEKRTFRSKWF